MIIANRIFLPLKLSQAKPYAAAAAIKIGMITDGMVTVTEDKNALAIVAPRTAFVPVAEPTL